MNTWVCSDCGSSYEVEFHFSPKPDLGEAKCEGCGKEIVSWEGGHCYIVRAIEIKRAPDSGGAAESAR